VCGMGPRRTPSLPVLVARRIEDIGVEDAAGGGLERARCSVRARVCARACERRPPPPTLSPPLRSLRGDWPLALHASARDSVVIQAAGAAAGAADARRRAADTQRARRRP
jgi:hypothetical protein